jgi:serine/threonine-protein kinase
MSARATPAMLGPYEIEDRIATGGMAEVYLARRAGPFGFQKRVAVKRILPQLAKDPDFVSMFIDEARVSARLGHPNIVSVFDFGEHEGELYMAMEYVDGSSCAKVLRTCAQQGRPIPIEVVLQIALSTLRGLDYAHSARDDQGKGLDIVHRDVSPGNILIDRSGAVKITDFGIARAAEIERRTDAGQLKGKLGYMSPEQVIGRELDPRSDLFTLGILLAELLTLEPLFAGPSEIDVLLKIRDGDTRALDRANIADELRPVLQRALARDRGQRYPSAAAFASDIEEVVRTRRLRLGPDKLADFLDRLQAPRTSGEMRIDTSRPTERPAAFERLKPRLTDRPPGAAREDTVPEIYRVQLRGETVGPLTFPRIIEMFVTGRVDSKTLVSREGGPFREARGYPELLRFVSSPALSWEKDELGSGLAQKQPLDRAKLPKLIFDLVDKRETGVLFFANGDRKKKVFFSDGMVEIVSSTNAKELLGEQLVDHGQVLRMELDMALAMLPAFSGRLGDALVGLGILRPAELFRAIYNQTVERFTDGLQWAAGDLGFRPGARSHEDTIPLGIDVLGILGKTVRESYTLEDIARATHPHRGELLEPRVALDRLGRYRLLEAEENVLRLCDGNTTMADVTSRAVSSGIADTALADRAIFLGLSYSILRAPSWR